MQCLALNTRIERLLGYNADAWRHRVCRAIDA
jgi:hypothetical protein